MKKLTLLTVVALLSVNALAHASSGALVLFNNTKKDISFTAENVDGYSSTEGVIASEMEESFYPKKANNPIVITLTNPKGNDTGSKLTIKATNGKITINDYTSKGFMGKLATDPKKLDMTVEDIRL